MIRLSVYIPVIHKLISESTDGSVDVSSVFPKFYSCSTIKRRSSSIIHIIKDIESEFQVKTSLNNNESYKEGQYDDKNGGICDECDAPSLVIDKVVKNGLEKQSYSSYGPVSI